MADDYAMTLEDLGAAFGVCGDRIRQIETMAFRKMRHPSLSKRLKPYIDHVNDKAAGRLGQWWARGHDGRGNRWILPAPRGE